MRQIPKPDHPDMARLEQIIQRLDAEASPSLGRQDLITRHVDETTLFYFAQQRVKRMLDQFARGRIGEDLDDALTLLYIDAFCTSALFGGQHTEEPVTATVPAEGRSAERPATVEEALSFVASYMTIADKLINVIAKSTGKSELIDSTTVQDDVISLAMWFAQHPTEAAAAWAYVIEASEGTQKEDNDG